MTRTERAQFPRAVAKDRHDSRTGLNRDPHHIPKNGEGKHSWGSDDREYDHEAGAFEDDAPVPIDEAVETAPATTRPVDMPARKSSQDVSNEERDKARALRTNALSSGIDLGSIARTSAGVSTSPTSLKSAPIHAHRDSSPV